MYTLERMTADHEKPVIDIFNYYIVHSFAAFLEQPLPYEYHAAFLGRIGTMPSCVAKDDSGQVVGFAFLRPYHPAPTLRRTAEIGYFLHPEHTRRSLGGQILTHLMNEAREIGVDNLVACISSLNEPSLAFHRTHGFAECGRFKAIGRKNGRDFDVIWMQRKI
jgi:L-amino acid N-acyltransferase YncA